MKILFRADSSSEIGLGHIMRDLVLASRFEEDEIIFASQELEGNIIKQIPYPIMILKTAQIDELIELIKNNSIDMLVIDHYGIDYDDEKKIKDATGVKILALDDTYERHHCDTLLNHNISANPVKYKNLVPDFCELRCGSKYTLIREEFKKEKVKRAKKRKSKKRVIFLAMGGSDHKGITLEILKSLKLYKKIQVRVVTTSSNQKLKQLKRFSQVNKWVQLDVDSKEMAQLMNNSELMIVTPSVIVHEALFLKKKFIAIKTAENQSDIYNYLKKRRFPVTLRSSHLDRHLKRLL